VQPLFASKSSFERIFLGVSCANFSGRATTCNVRPFEVVIERFCQTRQFKCRPADGAREAVDQSGSLRSLSTLLHAFFYRFLETFCPAHASFLSSYCIRCCFESLTIVTILIICVFKMSLILLLQIFGEILMEII